MIRKVEIALAALALVALLLKVADPDGSPVFSLCALGALALYYLVGSTALFNGTPAPGHAAAEPLSLRRRAWSVVVGIIFAIALTGMLFAVNYWRLAPFFWTLGMMLLVPAGAGSLGPYLLQKDRFYLAIAIRVGILLVCGIALVAIRAL